MFWLAIILGECQFCHVFASCRLLSLVSSSLRQPIPSPVGLVSSPSSQCFSVCTVLISSRSSITFHIPCLAISGAPVHGELKCFSTPVKMFLLRWKRGHLNLSSNSVTNYFMFKNCVPHHRERSCMSRWRHAPDKFPSLKPQCFKSFVRTTIYKIKTYKTQTGLTIHK